MMLYEIICFGVYLVCSCPGPKVYDLRFSDARQNVFYPVTENILSGFGTYSVV